MKKSEIFALVAGMIGLLADVITLSIFFSQKNSDVSSGAITSATKILIAGSIIYGWFIISWMLVRKNWLKSGETKKIISQRQSLNIDSPDIDWLDIDSSSVELDKIYRRELSEYLVKMAGIVIAAVGSLLIPLQWLFLSILFPIDDPLFYGSQPSDKIQWFMFIALITVISLLFIGVLVFFSIVLLMPNIYEDMNDIHIHS